ncbi:hypothetical protein FPRO04_13696 [Fusarium proliferatum]|nr:hypothetical protein FPRO04_13696 [Fusarium proliferatum]
MAAELEAMKENKIQLQKMLYMYQAKPHQALYYLQEVVHTVDEKYQESRKAWFNQQPPSASLTNLAYGEAAGLPLGYPAVNCWWRREEGQMGPFFKLHNSDKLRDWTLKEMHSWIDADNRGHDNADDQEQGLLEAAGPNYVSLQGPASHVGTDETGRSCDSPDEIAMWLVRLMSNEMQRDNSQLGAMDR